MSNEKSNPKKRESEPWTRFWIPTDTWERFRGIDENFLSDYGGVGGAENLMEDPLPGVGTLEQHSVSSFLTLLGRPGSGKSKELEIAEKAGWLGENAIFIQGKSIGEMNPGLFLQNFYGDAMKEPKKLVFDGLDEILLTNRLFVSQLKAWLKAQTDSDGRQKHTLVISCRWADWPEEEIAELAELWPTREVKTLVIAPIRSVDAITTLKKRFGAKADDFWKQLHDFHLFQVACWPQAFLGLIDQFEESGGKGIAQSYGEIIGYQVKKLFMLTDSRGEGLRWEKSVREAEWRGRIAGRIAATMAVSGMASFAVDSDKDDDVIDLGDLSDGTEVWDGKRIAPQRSDYDSLPKLTRLFRKLAGRDRWVFQSQVHQEWLAADWLASRDLGIIRLKQIFGVETAGGWRVAPAMQATAAWFAQLDKPFRKEVLANDPLTLLRMDGASLQDDEKKEIVEALLRATDDVRVLDPAIRQAHLPSLKHAKLKQQLTKWLSNPDANEAAKELAVDIAEKTRLEEICSLLWKIFPDASKRLKIELAGALGRLAKDGYERRWRDVLAGKVLTDAHGTLLGYALEILVVDTKMVPVGDVMSHVLPERHFDVFGGYDMAVRNLQNSLQPDDLPAVFSRLAENPHALHGYTSIYSDFNTSAVSLAIENFENPVIASVFCDYWHECLRFHVVPVKIGETIEGKMILTDLSDTRRRAVALALVSHPGFDRQRGKGWVSLDYYLLAVTDFGWCLEKLRAASPEDEWRFSILLSSMIWRVDLSGKRGDELNAAWNESLALKSDLPPPLEGELVSEAIQRIIGEGKAKRDGEAQKYKEATKQRKADLQKRLANDLQECKNEHEKGHIVWPGVFRFLLFRTSGSQRGIITFAPIQTIRQDEGWMIDAAARFIVETPLKRELDHNITLSGLLALAACKEQIDKDGSVRHSLKSEWLEVFIPFLCNHGLGDPPEGIGNEHFAELFPQEFVDAFEKFTRKQYSEDAKLEQLNQLTEINLPALSDSLETILCSEHIHNGGFFNAVSFLAAKNEKAAIRVLSAKLPLPKNASPDEATPLLAASMILANGRLGSEVKSYFENAELFVGALRYAVSRIRWRVRELDFSEWSDLSLKHLAEACWKAFPVIDRHRNKRGRFEFSEVTDDDNVMEFRDRISSAARSRGIEVDIPEDIEGENPEDAQERQHLIDWHRHANSQFRVAAGWHPLSPKEFFRIAEKPHARLARNQDELMAAVEESLQRWEESLTKNGHWHRLWDGRKIKHEKIISREMAEWLQQNLELQVDCEVEPILDNRADLLVRTIPSDGISSALQVVIEVKKLRADNSGERKKAMKTQLLDRYLKSRVSDGWTHGLFVVAWTPEPGSANDSKDKMAAQRQELEQQAVDLSFPPFTLKSLVLDCRFRGKLAKT